MYDFLLCSNYNNVEWVLVFDSWKPWLSVGIFAITHGNEPIWLRIIAKLNNDIACWNVQVLSWKIYCIAISLETYKQYIQQEDYLTYRFMDYNMNRIYKKKWISGYEYERFQLLLPIFDELDVAIDIHSIAKDDHVMAISNKKYYNEAKAIFDAPYLLLHEDLGKMWSMIGYLLDQWKPAFGIECGNHLTEKSFEKWYKNILSFLSYYGSIARYLIIKSDVMQCFEFLEEIMPISEEFSYSRSYSHFEPIYKGEIFAHDREKNYRNDYGYSVYIWLIGKKTKVWDWNWFLFCKV